MGLRGGTHFKQNFLEKFSLVNINSLKKGLNETYGLKSVDHLYIFEPLTSCEALDTLMQTRCFKCIPILSQKLWSSAFIELFCVCLF